MVHRGEKLIGKIQVSELKDGMCMTKIIERYDDIKFQKGDKVIYLELD